MLGRDVALIPQDPLTALNPGHTIGSAARRRAAPAAWTSTAAQAPAPAASSCSTRCRSASPAAVLRQYPHELSGGMRQRVLIAMAFACKPQLIVADEPTTALDVTVQREVLRLLRALQRDEGAAVLFITHDLGLVAKLCDRVSVIHSGRIVEDGDVRAHPRSAEHRPTPAPSSPRRRATTGPPAR